MADKITRRPARDVIVNGIDEYLKATWPAGLDQHGIRPVVLVAMSQDKCEPGIAVDIWASSLVLDEAAMVADVLENAADLIRSRAGKVYSADDGAKGGGR
jgi:hypothetical protein